MSFINIQPYLTLLLSGTLITIALLLFSLIIGLFAAISLVIGDVVWPRVFKLPINCFVFVIRGTPLLVQFFLIYFGSSQFAWVRESFIWVILKKPFGCAVLALAINTCAYTTVLLRGAIKSIPKGEVEAAHALGMSRFLLLRKIVLPRAFRIAMPAYSNEVVMILQGTSLASTITLLDLMGATQRVISQTYAAIEFLLIAGAIYFVLNAMIMATFRVLENRYRVLV
jgi:arginine transport system permease protein